MDRKMLRDDQWKRIEPLCSGKASERGVTGRDLPQHFGAWHTVDMRFSRWSKNGVWARMADALKRDADLEQLFVDSTIVRAHQHATGAQKKQAIKPSDGAGVG